MSDLVQEFGTFLAHYKLDTPTGALQAVFDQMKPEKAKLVRLCAIPHQFSVEILRVLAPDLSLEAAQKRCNEFAEYPAIRVYDGKLYVINEAAREQVFKQWLEPACREEFVAANKRLVDYFSRGDEDESADSDARRLNRVFHLIGASPEAGFEAFEDLFKERRRRSSLEECDALIKLVHEYDILLSPLQRAKLAYNEGKLATDRYRTDESKKLFELVIATPESDPVLRTKALTRLGLVETEQRNWSVAISHFQKALELAKTVSDSADSKQLQYRIKLNLGVTYREMGDLEKAKHLLLESIHEAHRISNATGMAMGYNSLGTLFRKIGEGKSAIKAYLKSLKLVELQDQPYRLAQVYNNLGLAYLDERNWVEGEKVLQKSLTIKRDSGDTIGLGKTYNNLMQVFRVQQLELEAVAAANSAIKCFAEVGDYYDMGLATRNLGRLYRAFGKKQEAVEYLTKAIPLFERSQATGEALALQEEVSLLTLGKRKRKMPWWAWVLYLSAAAIVALILFGFIYAILQLALDVFHQ